MYWNVQSFIKNGQSINILIIKYSINSPVSPLKKL